MDKCTERVYDGTFKGHTCTRKAVRDGWCKQHHPESVKARRDKQNEKWDAECKQREASAERRCESLRQEGRKEILAIVRKILETEEDRAVIVIKLWELGL